MLFLTFCFFLSLSLSHSYDIRIESEKSLKHFFTAFVDYCGLTLERYELFKRMRDNHPSHLSIPAGRLGSTLWMTATSGGGGGSGVSFEWCCNWEIEIESDNRISQKIEIVPRFLENGKSKEALVMKESRRKFILTYDR
jgi:hypothetical protein